MRFFGLLILLSSVTFGVTPVPPHVEPSEEPGHTRLVSLAADGKLVRHPWNEQGDLLPDYTGVGYRENLEPIPDVPVKKTLSPTGTDEDDTARIQAALDEMAALPLDSQGRRGALLLKRGRYSLSNTVFITNSGVVLRGEGMGEDGTILRATARRQYTAIMAGFKLKSVRPDEVKGSRREVADPYLPVGKRTVTVKGDNPFQVGDRVVFDHQYNMDWVNELEMGPEGRLGKTFKTPWKAPPVGNGWRYSYERRVVAVSGNTVTLQTGIPDSLNPKYGTAVLYKGVFPDRLREIGVEDLRVVSVFDESKVDAAQDQAQTWRYQDPYAKYVDEDHCKDAVQVVGVEDGWVRRITGVHLVGGTAYTGRTSRNITVSHCDYLHAVSKIMGGRRYPYSMGGPLCLAMSNRASTGRHSFALDAFVPGPTVYLDNKAEKCYAISEPHHLWSTGVLYDNCDDTSQIGFMNRGKSGDGHGWTSVGGTLWNCRSPILTVMAPQTGMNFAIGCPGPLEVPEKVVETSLNETGWSFMNIEMPDWREKKKGTMYGNGWMESWSAPVSPRSLYEKQMEEVRGKK